MERLITKRQEQIYRMRHHNFDGLDCKTVAKILGITMASVSRHMLEMERVAPQLFPILTQRQALIRNLYVEMGLSHEAIGNVLGISKSCVGVLLHRMRKKGADVPSRVDSKWFFKVDKPKQYDPLYDSRIVRKF